MFCNLITYVLFFNCACFRVFFYIASKALEAKCSKINNVNTSRAAGLLRRVCAGPETATGTFRANKSPSVWTENGDRFGNKHIAAVQTTVTSGAVEKHQVLSSKGSPGHTLDPNLRIQPHDQAKYQHSGKRSIVLPGWCICSTCSLTQNSCATLKQRSRSSPAGRFPAGFTSGPSRHFSRYSSSALL